MVRGRCNGIDNPDFFYPDTRADQVKRFCAGCPVNVECLDYALDNMRDYGAGAFGIWGGTSPDQRWDMLRGTYRRKVAA
jgi:WhiB family redox-sensing transcriptional regulator